MFVADEFYRCIYFEIITTYILPHEWHVLGFGRIEEQAAFERTEGTRTCPIPLLGSC